MLAEDKTPGFLDVLEGIRPDAEGVLATQEQIDGLVARVKTDLRALSFNRGTTHVLLAHERLRAAVDSSDEADRDALASVVNHTVDLIIDTLDKVFVRSVDQGDVPTLVQARRNAHLSQHLIQLMDLIEQKGQKGQQINVKWVKKVHPELFGLIHEGCDRDWDLIRSLLPDSYHFWPEEKYVRDLNEDELEDRLNSMRVIADSMGPTVVAQLLMSMGLIGDAEAPLLRKKIREHFQDSQPNGEFKLEYLKQIPAEVLRDPELERVVFIHVRDSIYESLNEYIEGGLNLGMAWTIVSTDIQSHFNLKNPLHQNLWRDVQSYWKEVLSLDSSKRFNPTVKDESGTDCEFPSLRQRVSVVDLAGKHSMGRQINAFSMGKGKSACPFLAWEHLKETGRIEEGQKMILVCPPTVITQFQSRIRDKYYLDGKAPSVGVIASGVTKKAEDIEAALESEIVLVADSMLTSGKVYKNPPAEVKEDERFTPIDLIRKANIAYLCVDEAHRFKNPATQRASALEELARIDDPSLRVPFIQLLSATPMPNRIKDMMTYLKVLYPALHRDDERISDIDPLRLRNVLLKCLLVLDPPEEWQKEVDYREYELGPAERAIYEIIRRIPDMNILQKLQAARQFLLNPALLDHNDLDEHALFDAVVEDIRSDFKETNCVLVGHGSYTEGFTRTGDRTDSTWVKKLEAEFGKDVEVLIVDGQVSDAKRKELLARPAEEPDKQFIILCNADTIRLGISLVHIKSAMLLEHDFNEPDFMQFVRRFNRAGNKDSKIRCYKGVGTISEVIKDFAQLKAALCYLVKYGGGLTREHLREMEAAGVDIQNAADIEFGSYSDSVVKVALMIMEELTTSGAYIERFMRNFNCKGEERIKRVLSESDRAETFAERYMMDFPFTYQGNNVRLTAAVVNDLIDSGELPSGSEAKYLDLYSGPMGLATLLSDLDAETHSMDLNPFLLEEGCKLLEAKTGSVDPNQFHVGGMCDLNEHHEEDSLDLVNLSLCGNIPLNSQKRQMLADVNSRLKLGGKLVMTLPYYAGTREEREKWLTDVLPVFGFEVDFVRSGLATAGDKSETFESFVIVAKKTAQSPQTHLEKVIAASDMSLKLHDRSSRDGKRLSSVDKIDQQSLYAAHHRFNIKGTEIEIDEERDQVMYEYAQMRALQNYLREMLTTEPDVDLSTCNLPVNFQDLKLSIQKVTLGKRKIRWYLAIEREGDAQPFVCPIRPFEEDTD